MMVVMVVMVTDGEGDGADGRVAYVLRTNGGPRGGKVTLNNNSTLNTDKKKVV